MIKGPININDVKSIKVLEGIYRKTLTYNKELMLVQFILEKGAKLPRHDHEAHQIGYIISGKIKFNTEKQGEFFVKSGDSYIFDSYEKHEAFVIEKSEVIDIFNPPREDYKLA